MLWTENPAGATAAEPSGRRPVLAIAMPALAPLRWAPGALVSLVALFRAF